MTSIEETRTLEQWGAYLESEARAKYWKLGKPCFCGTQLTASSVKSYDHDGGVKVKGFKELQWVYLVCGKCGHEWSFTHILR